MNQTCINTVKYDKIEQPAVKKPSTTHQATINKHNWRHQHEAKTESATNLACSRICAKSWPCWRAQERAKAQAMPGCTEFHALESDPCEAKLVETNHHLAVETNQQSFQQLCSNQFLPANISSNQPVYFKTAWFNI